MMDDKEFNEMLKAKNITLEQFMKVYDITVYDLRDAIRKGDEKYINHVLSCFEENGWLRNLLIKIEQPSNIPPPS